jgi:hypothetical protein
MKALSQNIHRIKNFLNHKEIAKIVEFANAQPEIGGKTISSRAILQFRPDTEITSLVQSYQLNVEKIISRTYGIDVTDMSGTTVRKWFKGEFQAPHSDCEAQFKWNYDTWDISNINNFSSIFIEYAALTYLNDDYVGGEIYFPDHDLEIKPEPGELIFFPGTHFYIHGVREIISGYRYAMMTFFTTPKLQYLWRTFVLDETPLNFIDYSAEDSMENQRIFSRSNIPQTMTIFGQRFPNKKREDVNETEKPFW